MLACSGRMCACHARATWESGSAPCRPGRPTRCSTSRAWASGTPRVHRDEPDPPAGRGVARTGVTAVVLAEDAYHRRIPAGGAVLNGAGECTGFLHRPGVGRRGDAGLPDLDHAARPGVRRGLRARDRGAPRGGRRRGDPDRRRVRRLVAQRLPPDAGHRRRRASRACRGARLARRDAASRPRARSAPARACPASTSRAGSVRRPGSPPTATPSAYCCSPTSARRGPGGRRACPWAAPRPDRRPAPVGRPGPAGLLHRPRRHRRTRSTAPPASGWPAGSASAWPAPAAVAHNGSGEIFLGFGTGMRLDPGGQPPRPHGPGRRARASTTLFAAVVEATEESVLNSMFGARHRPSAQDGNNSESLHSPEVLALLEGVRS